MSEGQSLALRWNRGDADHGHDWDAAFSRIARPTFEQSRAYGLAAAATGLGSARRGLFTVGGEPVGLVQAVVRPVGRLLTLAQVTRGPLWCGTPPDDRTIAAGYATLRASFSLARRQVFIWVPAETAGTAAERRLGRVGKRPIITGHSTVWLDLAADEDTLRRGLRGKWRNLLAKAESATLAVEAGHGGRQLAWLLERYAAQRRARRFGGPSPALLALLPEVADRRADVLVLRALQRREPVSAALFLRHGASATWLAGWSGEAGRRTAAHNLLLWEAAMRLKKTGVRWLDLGGVDGLRAPGIARFKLGTGGTLETLAGTYL